MNKIAKTAVIGTVATSALALVAGLDSCRKAASGPYLEAALKGAAWIQASGIRTPEGLFWPASSQETGPAGLDLYSGVPDTPFIR